MENIPLDFSTFLIDAMRFDTPQDYDRYLGRLGSISTQVDEEIALMRQAIDYETTLHASSLVYTVQHLEEMVKSTAEESDFFGPFQEGLSNVAGKVDHFTVHKAVML